MDEWQNFFHHRQAQLITVGLSILKRPEGLGRGERLVVASINRGLGLLRGFCDLMRTGNVIAAAPLVRLQLDSGLRAFALFMTTDPHESAGLVADGQRLDKLRDRAGKRLSDRHIVDTLEGLTQASIAPVYERASGYVHLSQSHFYHAFDIREAGERPPDVEVKLGALDRFVSIEQRSSVTADFGTATDVLAGIGRVWLQMPRAGPPTAA